MFASGRKTKNILVRTSMTHRQLQLTQSGGTTLTTTTTKTAMSQRTPRRMITNGVDKRMGGSGIGAPTGQRLLPQMRSKFTEHKNIQTQLANGTTGRILRRNQIQSSGTKTNITIAAATAITGATFADGRKTIRGIPSNTAARANMRQLQRRELTTDATSTKLTEDPNKKIEHAVNITAIEIGIQTNEPEILNHDLIVGDIKLLQATNSIVTEIERQRYETRKKQLLKAKRKFEPHSEKQEEHLTHLKEFLEKSVISKRTHKPKLTVELDRKLISSMDELLNKGVPKTESITDIKGRIKKKEQELLTLFDTIRV